MPMHYTPLWVNIVIILPCLRILATNQYYAQTLKHTFLQAIVDQYIAVDIWQKLNLITVGLHHWRTALGALLNPYHSLRNVLSVSHRGNRGSCGFNIAASIRCCQCIISICTTIQQARIWCKSLDFDCFYRLGRVILILKLIKPNRTNLTY